MLATALLLPVIRAVPECAAAQLKRSRKSLVVGIDRYDEQPRAHAVVR